jgi:hypothetical protein
LFPLKGDGRYNSTFLGAKLGWCTSLLLSPIGLLLTRYYTGNGYYTFDTLGNYYTCDTSAGTEKLPKPLTFAFGC